MPEKNKKGFLIGEENKMKIRRERVARRKATTRPEFNQRLRRKKNDPEK